MSVAASTAALTTWLSLTTAVNEFKPANSFLRELYFPAGTERTMPTIDLEWSVYSRGRFVAPFVARGAEAIQTGGWSDATKIVRVPNIRIKKPVSPSQLLLNRMAGSVVFANGGSGDGGLAMSQAQAIVEQQARDLLGMQMDITNAEEWLVAQCIQGQITYADAASDAWTVSFGRSSSHNISLGVFWNDATLANIDIIANLHAVKRLMSEDGYVVPTDGVCGTEAADAFLALARKGGIPGFITGTSQTNLLRVGDISFETQFSAQGVIYLGSVSGIRFWEYGRSASLNGATVPMVRAKYVEFMNRDPNASLREFQYGAIEDLIILEGVPFIGRQFAKSWTTPDPAAKWNLIATCPLPIMRRPDATLSMKVVSG